MEAVQEQIDTLSHLEERITRAVGAITSLRNENHQLEERLHATQAELDSTRSHFEQQLKEAHQELNSLRDERRQVKERIEKLLGQLDLLSAS